MNWGWKIVLMYAAFLVMTLSMVFYFMGQKVDLVADDYYKKEIEYQDQIDKISNALDQEIKITYAKDTKSITFLFPERQRTMSPKGTIHFYRPSNAEEDMEFEVSPSDSGEQIIRIGSLSRGLWRIKISWTAGGTDFYSEKTITL